jgi:DNA-binding NarL/FixJ family response regulator
MPSTLPRGVRVVHGSGADAVFAAAAAPERAVRVVVADVDEYGVRFVGDLHAVFPALRLIALAEERSTRRRAVRAGAVLALPRSTPPTQLAKAIVRISGR